MTYDQYAGLLAALAGLGILLLAVILVLVVIARELGRRR